MIAYLRGKLITRTEVSLVVDTGGVGYEIFVPTSTLDRAATPTDEIELHIHTHVRDDGITLFGFDGVEEKGLFRLLISVTGIGPKLAMGILSHIPAAEFAAALAREDKDRIASIHGVGKKRAARLIIDLKDKVQGYVKDPSGAMAIPESL